MVNISSRFSSNSEAEASKLPENLEEMLRKTFPIKVRFKSVLQTILFSTEETLQNSEVNSEFKQNLRNI